MLSVLQIAPDVCPGTMDEGGNKRQTVEQRIGLISRQIARQLEIIEALQSNGYPTDGAERVLDRLKHVLQLREAELRRLQDSD